MVQVRQPPGIAASERDRLIDELEHDAFDVVVIGGGISGAGVMQEAARRGLRVALLEADDFASGTSSRSSKLIHGGLRYLLTGDLALVRKTAVERKVIHRLVPHLAEPRWMVIPARTRARLMQLRAAVSTYEKLGQVDPAERHQKWTHDELEQEEPVLRRAIHRFACAYREYVTDDARLVLANIRDAVSRGSRAANRARVEHLLFEGDRVAGVHAKDVLTGREFTVRGKVVVNAAGPWVEQLQRLEDPSTRPILQLAKGIHAVIPRERLPLNNLVVFEAKDKRHLFTVPRGDVVYIGTTDTAYRHGPNLWPNITSNDLQYVLENVTEYFDVDAIGENDLVGAWAGIRPLLAEPGKKMSEISRRDAVLVGAGGMVSIAGGKLTGYRFVAKQVMDVVAKQLGTTNEVADVEAPLPGGDFSDDLDSLAARIAQRHGLLGRVARRLVQLYGSETEDVLALGGEQLSSRSGVVAGEVDWAVRHEGAVSVEDVVYRRCRIALYEPHARDAVQPIAERMARLFGWNNDQVAEQLRQVRNRLAADLTFAPEEQAATVGAGVPVRA